MLKRNPFSVFFACARERFSKEGQALIEAIIAVSLLSVGLTGILALLNQSLRLNGASAENYTATYLAAEGIEVARNIIDANAIQGKSWNNGFSDSTNYQIEYDSNSMTPVGCVIDQCPPLKYNPDTHLYDYAAGSADTPFRRLIKISFVGNDEIKISSIVSWVGAGGGSFSVNLEDHFMNWRT